MYLPAHFEETRTEVLHTLIAEYPLGALVTLGSDGLTANHIPFLVDSSAGEHGRLIGHVARNNALWHDHDANLQALVIFQGPSAYISPNWYATKLATHEVVPTYNYAVVHAHGPLIIHDDPKWLRGVVGKLTKAMESSQAVPWKMPTRRPGSLPVNLKTSSASRFRSAALSANGRRARTAQSRTESAPQPGYAPPAIRMTQPWPT